MQAGLERTSGAGYGRWVASEDWVSDALSRPFVAKPGARLLYSTGSFHVLGAVLALSAGQDLHTLAESWLGDPLGIDFPHWTRDPQGRYPGGNEMALSPLEMARIGELYRLGGRWQGERVFAAGWVERSFTAHTRSPWSGIAPGRHASPVRPSWLSERSSRAAPPCSPPTRTSTCPCRNRTA